MTLAPITDVLRRQVASSLRLELADGRLIRVTAEHPFWDATQQRYRPLGTFQAGEPLLVRAFTTDAPRQRHDLATRLLKRLAPLVRGILPTPPVTTLLQDSPTTGDLPGSAESLVIQALVPLDGSVEVFNITVAGTHTYFAEGVLVHNKAVCTEAQ